MKRCPICKTVYSDDANFCPMDAVHLEDVASASPGPLPSLDLPTMQARLIGARFQIGPQIGGKRTGEVFSGEDITTGQSCAVKIIAPSVFPTPLVAQRTERELKQLMKVSSDRITKVIDVGKQGDRLYVAMELVSGVTLAEILATNGPIPPDQAARLGVEIAEGLAEAAKLGVIHRDVSPKNVVVVADNRGNRRVKLLNFGVPTPADDRVLGVPEFLSPEQAEGKPVDQRSNIYSLGALLYTMVTGAPPFSGTTDEVLQQQVSAAPVPPSERAPRAGVSPELDRLILKALEKASSRRHLTLRQLLGELETIAGHLPASHPVPLAESPPPPRAGTGPVKRTSAQHAAQPSPDGGHERPRTRSTASKTIVGLVFPPSQAPPPAAAQARPRTADPAKPKAAPAAQKPARTATPSGAAAAVAPEPGPPASGVEAPAVTFSRPPAEASPGVRAASAAARASTPVAEDDAELTTRKRPRSEALVDEPPLVGLSGERGRTVIIAAVVGVIVVLLIVYFAFLR